MAFIGRMFFTLKSARDLPNQPGIKDIRPYLVIKVDNVEQKRVGYKENHEEQEVTKNPIWDDEEVELNVDESKDESIQLVIFHNSAMEPHIILAYVDISIGEISNLYKNTDAEVLHFNNQQFTNSSGTIKFEVEVNEELKGISKRDAVPKVYTYFCHKFRVKAFPMNDKRNCAICNSLLWAGRGVECEHCDMVTHRQCCQYTLTKCRNNPIDINADNAPAARFELNQEHQFPQRPFLVANPMLYCSHCGDNFWWLSGLNNPRAFAYKCGANNCGTHVHEQCKHRIGTGCGMNLYALAKNLQIADERVRQRIEEEKARNGTSIRLVRTNSGKVVSIGIDDFDLLKTLGQGGFGKVYLARHKKTEELLALKAVKKSVIIGNQDYEITKTERNVLALGRHSRFITNLFCTFKTTTKLIFVMEFLSGGDLFYHLDREGRFSEERTRFYDAQISLAFLFLHSKGIVYRDLKLDNVMMTNEGNVKLTDFGMCKENIDTNLTGTFCGTPHFIAPEIISNSLYGYSPDWWSLGILTHEMMCGVNRYPFNAQDEDDLYMKIQTRQPRLQSRCLSDLSRSFIGALLKKNVSERLTGEDVKGHEFFSGIDWELLEAGEVKPPFKPRDASVERSKQRPQISTRNTMDEDMMAEGDKYLADFSFYPEQD